LFSLGKENSDTRFAVQREARLASLCAVYFQGNEIVLDAQSHLIASTKTFAGKDELWIQAGISLLQ
jgi:hypothetical protein